MWKIKRTLGLHMGLHLKEICHENYETRDSYLTCAFYMEYVQKFSKKMHEYSRKRVFCLTPKTMENIFNTWML